jgi:hypothetical protein
MGITLVGESTAITACGIGLGFFVAILVSAYAGKYCGVLITSVKNKESEVQTLLLIKKFAIAYKPKL